MTVLAKERGPVHQVPVASVADGPAHHLSVSSGKEQVTCPPRRYDDVVLDDRHRRRTGPVERQCSHFRYRRRLVDRKHRRPGKRGGNLLADCRCRTVRGPALREALPGARLERLKARGQIAPAVDRRNHDRQLGQLAARSARPGISRCLAERPRPEKDQGKRQCAENCPVIRARMRARSARSAGAPVSVRRRSSSRAVPG